MADQPAESLFTSLFSELDDADKLQPRPALQVVAPGMARFPCLRGSFAPLETCPQDAPPNLVAQLDCDEDCPSRTIEHDRQMFVEPRPEIESQPAAVKPAPVRIRRAAA